MWHIISAGYLQNDGSFGLNRSTAGCRVQTVPCRQKLNDNKGFYLQWFSNSTNNKLSGAKIRIDKEKNRIPIFTIVKWIDCSRTSRFEIPNFCWKAKINQSEAFLLQFKSSLKNWRRKISRNHKKLFSYWIH